MCTCRSTCIQLNEHHPIWIKSLSNVTSAVSKFVSTINCLCINLKSVRYLTRRNISLPIKLMQNKLKTNFYTVCYSILSGHVYLQIRCTLNRVACRCRVCCYTRAQTNTSIHSYEYIGRWILSVHKVTADWSDVTTCDEIFQDLSLHIQKYQIL